MQLKIESLDELSSDELKAKEKPLSMYSSSISLDQDEYYSDADDLDRLSMCLSEASSESSDGKRTSLFHDLLNAQLALWTLIGSIFYSYAWQQHRKKFLLTLFVVVPPVLIVCCTISSLLTAIVILGRIFSTPLRFEDMLNFGATEDSYNEVVDNINRQWASSISVRSMSEETLPRELPKPMCRKHSTSNGSLHQVTMRSASPNSFNGSNGRSPHRLSYQFSHSIGGGAEESD